jgi:hypothetical protein
MDIRLRKANNIFKRPYKGCIIRLSQDMVYKSLLGKVIHDPRDPVPTQTIRLTFWMSNSEHEIWRHKGSVLNASAACSASQVEWVLGGVGWEVSAISAEPSVSVEDIGFKDGN